MNTLRLSLAALVALPGIAAAQLGPSYLSAPDGNPTNALIVAAGGNIGIGKISPEVTLDVAGSGLQITGGDFWTTDNWLVRLKSPLSSAWRLTSPDDTGKYIGIGMAGSGWYFIKSDTADGAGPVAYPMVIRENGNVGIGTASPRSALHVVGDDVRFEKFNHSLVFNANAGGDATRAEIVSDIALAFAPGNTEKMRLDINGNVGIGTTTPLAKLDVNGKINCSVLELTSDRNQKAGFASVDGHELLRKVARLLISSWHYTNAPGVRHIGPMAQDFQATFHFGTDDKHIATIDADGVLFASVQALNEELQETKAELAVKGAHIAALEQKLAQMDVLAGRIASVEKMFARAKPVSTDSAQAPKFSNRNVSSALQESEDSVP